MQPLQSWACVILAMLFVTPLLAQVQHIDLSPGDGLRITCPTHFERTSDTNGIEVHCAKQASTSTPIRAPTVVAPTATQAAPTQWNPITGLGVIGDSGNDEYQGTDARGGAYRARPPSSTTLLVSRGLWWLRRCAIAPLRRHPPSHQVVEQLE